MPNMTLENCVCIGGAGYSVALGAASHLTISESEVLVRVSRDVEFSIPLLEVSSIDISGPGTVTSGGGFAGGGFGVGGALQGMAVSMILNSLTTKSKIHTFVSLITNVGELHFHYAGMEPTALRIALSPAFTVLRRQDPIWQRNRLDVLEFERKYRGLPDSEFDRLSARIYQPLPKSPNETADELVRLEYPVGAGNSSGPFGRCPSCRSTILLDALECPKCKAKFECIRPGR
jgi:hypothetical protein